MFSCFLSLGAFITMMHYAASSFWQCLLTWLWRCRKWRATGRRALESFGLLQQAVRGVHTAAARWCNWSLQYSDSWVPNKNVVLQSLSALLKIACCGWGELGKTDAKRCTCSLPWLSAIRATKEKTCDLASALGKALLSLAFSNQNNDKESRISKSSCYRDSGRVLLLLLLLCLVPVSQSAVDQRARDGWLVCPHVKAKQVLHEWITVFIGTHMSRLANFIGLL